MKIAKSKGRTWQGNGCGYAAGTYVLVADDAAVLGSLLQVGSRWRFVPSDAGRAT